MSKHKKIRFILHYVKPTAQLLFRIRFPKGGPTCRRQVVNPRHQTPQGQSNIASNNDSTPNVQKMAWRIFGAKPLSETMLAYCYLDL